MDHREVAQKAIEILRSFPEAKELILYGSVMRGDFRPDSDIDLAFVIEEGYRMLLLDNEGMPLGLSSRVRTSLRDLETSSGIEIQIPFYWASEFDGGIKFPQREKLPCGNSLNDTGKIVYSVD